MRWCAPALFSVVIVVTACGADEDGSAVAAEVGSFSPITLSNGDIVDLYTPQGWSVTDYSASGLIAETEEDTIYAMIDPSRMDAELLMAASSDSDKYDEYQIQLKQGGMVNILFTPVAACAELLTDMDDDGGETFDTDFLDNAALATVDEPADEDFDAYKMQSVWGLVPLSDGVCAGAHFAVFDPDQERGADLLKQIATRSLIQQ